MASPPIPTTIRSAMVVPLVTFGIADATPSMSTMSVAPGTPLGDQFPAVPQSSVVPTHILPVLNTQFGLPPPSIESAA